MAILKKALASAHFKWVQQKRVATDVTTLVGESLCYLLCVKLIDRVIVWRKYIRDRAPHRTSHIECTFTGCSGCSG